MVKYPVIVFLLVACSGRTEPGATDAAAPDGSAACSNKIRFAQALGCANDGSVEFCLPTTRQDVLDGLDLLVTVTCGAGRGRADCVSPQQVLCFYPTTTPAVCVDELAMTDAAYADMCELAALEQVDKIVPTIFE